jgi:restriction system protein
MNFLDAAFEILKQANTRLHYTEIARRAMNAGLLVTSGQTPEATMGSRLYVDTNRPESRFHRVGRGFFELSKQVDSDEIGQRVEEINAQTRKRLRQELADMPADRFEALIGELLIAIGFDEASVQVTRYSGDRGIDVRGDLIAGGITQIRAAVQAKKWKHNVQATTVREVRGSLTSREQGIIITTSDFSRGAREEASAVGKTPVSLVNGQMLLELLIVHEIGVTKHQHTVLSLDEEWWGEVTGALVEQSSSSNLPNIVVPPTKSMEVTFPITVRAGNDKEKMALLLGPDGRMTYNGQQFGSPSMAGKAASGWNSCNGWTYWRFEEPTTREWLAIDHLRTKIV